MKHHHSLSYRLLPLLVALLPGLLVLSTMNQLDSTGIRTWILYAVCLAVGIATVWKTRSVPLWLLPTLGILLNPFALPLLLSIGTIWGDSTPSAPMVPWFVLMMPWLAGTFIFAARLLWVQFSPLQKHKLSIPPLVWALLLAIYVVGAVGAILVFAAHPAERTSSEMMITMLSPTIGMVLLVVTVGTWLVRYTGVRTGLLVVTSSFVLWNITFEYSYGLWQTPWGIAMTLVHATMLLIIAPLWVLTSQSKRGQVFGLLVPTAVALISIVLIEPLVRTRPALLNNVIPLEQWLPPFIALAEQPWIGVGTQDPSLLWSLMLQNGYVAIQLFLCVLLSIILYQYMDHQRTAAAAPMRGTPVIARRKRAHARVGRWSSNTASMPTAQLD